MNLKRIDQIVEKYNLPKYKRQQLIDAFFRHYVSGFGEITTLSKGEREVLSVSEPVLSVEAEKVLVSREGNAFKALLRLKSSGELIETVLLNPKPGLWSTCISSQVGCAMGCSFCATGRMGLRQNLTAEEISDQVLFWKQYIWANGTRERRAHAKAGAKMDVKVAVKTGVKTGMEAGAEVHLSHVVFMGMGEPLANIEAVFEAIGELTDERGFNMAARHISVSTCGLVPGMKRLAEEFPQVNLALSLHAANDKLRSCLMPGANKAFPLKSLAAALREYLQKTNRKVFLEYVLIAGENDRDGDARELVAFVKSLRAPHLAHVNLIVYNKTDSGHEESRRAKAFRQILIDGGVNATIRKSLGGDIMAACGQLAGQ